MASEPAQKRARRGDNPEINNNINNNININNNNNVFYQHPESFYQPPPISNFPHEQLQPPSLVLQQPPQQQLANNTNFFHQQHQHQHQHQQHQQHQQQHQHPLNPPWCREYLFKCDDGEGEREVVELEKEFAESIWPQMERIQNNLKSYIQEGNDVLTLLISSTETKLNHIHSRLDELFNTTILSPPTLKSLLALKKNVTFKIQQLSLDKNEWNGTHSGPLSMIVVKKQPFPKLVKVKKGVSEPEEDPVLAQLLTPSGTNIRPNSDVTANVIFVGCENNTSSFCDSTQMDNHGFASFPFLKFEEPQRMKIARLQFNMETLVPTPEEDIVQQVESDLSAPFIVYTNESQWERGLFLLLQDDCFAHDENICFERFANLLQIYFLRSTRQDPADPERGLSIHDLNYFARRFNNKPMISKSEAAEFLKWFAAVVRRMRFHKSFYDLWVKGLVYGFIGRCETVSLLESQPPGTFLIRFSESILSKVVISSAREGNIENMLVGADIPAKKAEPPERLLNVLKKEEHLTQTVVINTDFNSMIHQVKIQDKGSAFGKRKRARVEGDYVLDCGEE